MLLIINKFRNILYILIIIISQPFCNVYSQQQQDVWVILIKMKLRDKINYTVRMSNNKFQIEKCVIWKKITKSAQDKSV